MRRKSTTNIIYLVLWNLLLITLIFLIQNKSFGQYYHAPTTWASLLRNWSVNANVGRTSFFGEVSVYDHEFKEKMSKDGSWAFGFELARQFTPVFGLSGQYLLGQLSGSNSKSHFYSNITEYSANLTINLVNMLIPDNDAHFFPYFKLGIGQFTYDTKLIYNDPNKADITAKSKNPEFLYLFGGGAFFVLTNAFNVNMEFTGRRMNNDRIDGADNKKDDDYYSYISLGVTYKINNIPRDTRYYKKMGMKSPLIRRR